MLIKVFQFVLDNHKVQNSPRNGSNDISFGIVPFRKFSDSRNLSEKKRILVRAQNHNQHWW